MRLQIEVDALEKIRNFVLARSGLYFKEHEMPSFQEQVAKRMAQTLSPTPSAYIELLTRESPDAHREFTELLNRLTNKHTHFFRIPAQFTALRDKILPSILERKAKEGDLSLKILSAGCSTGEEPYSIAMILVESFGRDTPWKLQVLATDISTEALVFAKRGIYPRGSLRLVEEEFLKRYLERSCLIHRDKLFVSPAVKNLVEFQFMNLVEDYYPQGFDIIFCRHVTIYFEPQTIKSVIERLYQSLAEDGYLFTGGTETLYGISEKFEMVDVADALVYQKLSGQKRKSPPSPRFPSPPPATPVISPSVHSLEEAQDLVERARERFQGKAYEEAHRWVRLALEKEPALEAAHLLLAEIFLHEERWGEAEEVCQKAITLDFLAREPRYLVGLIEKKRQRPKEALDSLKKAIYLDPNYSLAYFTMAELYQEQGQAQEALRAYRNTLKALDQEPEEDFQTSSGGLSKRALAEVCVKKMRETSDG